MVDRFNNNGKEDLNIFSKIGVITKDSNIQRDGKINSPNSSNILSYNPGKSGNIDNEK